MKDGFIKAAAVTPAIRVADPAYNGEQVIRGMREAAAAGAKIIVFPELVMTGYTCQDLFLQKVLLDRALEELAAVAAATGELDALVFVGTPAVCGGKLYNCLAAVSRGRVLGLIPKTYLPNYGEFYERRHFAPGSGERRTVRIPAAPSARMPGDDSAAGGAGAPSGALPEPAGYEVPLSANLLFACREMPDLVLAGELCEDIWSPDPPSRRHALAGATVIVNGSASDEATGKASYRRSLVTGQSGRLLCGYVYASAGEGESSQDLVFGGHNLIAENGELLAEAPRFTNTAIYADLDIDRLAEERRRNTCFGPARDEGYETIPFDLAVTQTPLSRTFPRTPFVPAGERDRAERCEEILSIQSLGLAKRLSHTGSRRAVIGLSGGLDSTLALLVIVRAFDHLKLPREGICAVTMPCFGTTDRTYRNACRLAESVGATLREISIRDAVRVHFRDIGQEETNHDVTYENGQARERTQILMDVANQVNGLVVGTGDMSELALGWATYNGDHMSMYGVNVGVPKTLVRHLVRYFADTCGEERLAATLTDVLDTPVSPELLPPEDGKITQKTEDLVGPYELHDFFLYYMLRFGFPPAKIFRLALQTFDGIYDAAAVKKWLITFYRRFFSQQFKRSCLPDGPRVGSVALSPRGDLRMPSDACGRIWLEEAERL